ncbi:MAG: aspartate dehydrogenase [Rhodobacterales bacterium]|nr:MAG: aspartate dehydrogenase [Rhodobacterales bacterium]PIE12564.1 MAG: aspartate dehydrogenase [Rhodobacterales bacterium]
MKFGVIGNGAIARYVEAHLGAPEVRLLRRPPADGGPWVAQVDEIAPDVELMVDCAGHGALAQHGPQILRRGIPLVTVSIGALADEDLHQRLTQAAQAGKTQLHLASGAIGALDCLRAARVGTLQSVEYSGRKPPAGWRGSPAEERLDLDHLTAPEAHFSGTAREASLRYPKNANVAAAVALAGIGFDRTRVTLIADPTVTANIHEVRASGSFGAFSFRIEGRALPDNPKSSALAAMSAVAAARRLSAPITG